MILLLTSSQESRMVIISSSDGAFLTAPATILSSSSSVEAESTFLNIRFELAPLHLFLVLLPPPLVDLSFSLFLTHFVPLIDASLFRSV